MNEMIVSIYDGLYQYAVAINGKAIDEETALDICRPFDDFPKCWDKIAEVINKYDCSRAIVCGDGGIDIYEKRGGEICKTLSI